MDEPEATGSVDSAEKGKPIAPELFGGLAESYDRVADYATLFQDRYWKKWATQRARARRGELVLDVGCGTLLLEECLAGRGLRFVGVDLTREMIRIGQAKGLSDVSLLVNGDAESLPFPDQSFDSVVSCYVAKYVDTESFAEELARVIKLGSTVVLYDFVRPRGPLAPFLKVYINTGLRLVGFLLGLAKKESAFTFSNLHRIVDGSTWDREIDETMKANGFETVALERLTGGIVCAYCGVKVKDVTNPGGSLNPEVRGSPT